MAVNTTTLPPFSSSFSSKTLKSKSPIFKTLISKSQKSKTLNSKKSPPVSISTDPIHLDPHLLLRLFSSASHSPHRFPLLSSSGSPELADAGKIAVAVANSDVVVSVFCRQRFLDPNAKPGFRFEDIFERTIRVPDPDHQLVGFGRAVSDGGLTASIHDVVVMPTLQRMGIGRKIVQRIIRLLTSKEIYDISALCTQKERLFFRACGFGGDSLGSTTMMYTRTSLSSSQEMVRPAGRLLLLVPSSRELHPSKKITLQADFPDNASSKTA